MLATTMSANVFFWIIPGQKKVIAQMRAGQAPEPIHGQRGKQRSVHNTYFTLPVLLALQFLMGLTSALVNMANVRLAMAIIPVMGRDHFFALFSVVGSLMMGLSPILWGLLIDSLRGLDVAWPGFALNRYSLFFALTGLVFVVTFGLCQRLEEPKAASMEALLRDILIESPQRVWVRLWPKA